MFEFGRELRRLLSGEPPAAPQDGLTGGDATLLELLDLHLLTNEARGADHRLSLRESVRPGPVRPQRPLTDCGAFL